MSKPSRNPCEEIQIGGSREITGPPKREPPKRPEMVSSPIGSQKELWETIMDAKSGDTWESVLNFISLTAHATLSKPVVLQKAIQSRGLYEEPKFFEVPLEAGTRVNVVMASRFGHVGITDNLEVLNGYDCCIKCVEMDGGASEEVYLVDIVLKTPVKEG